MLSIWTTQAIDSALPHLAWISISLLYIPPPPFQITPFKGTFCKFSYLWLLDLSYNSFNDFIHVCLMERNSTLRVLNLTGNKLKGYLSDTTSSSCNSRFLNLNGNLLSGIIPNSLANKSYILETISLVIDFEVKHFHCMC